MDYPPNSDKAKAKAPKEAKKVERVTEGEPIRRKKSLGKQFRETFIGGDAKTTAHFVIFGVLIPAAKDALADAGSQGLEKLIYGESRSTSRRRGSSPNSGATGYVSYNRFSMGRQSQQERRPSMSRRARANFDFDEIVLEKRPEAEQVIDSMFDLLSKYEFVSVADLYELIGLESSHTDNKWGWYELQGAGVSRVRNGYLLDLPDPEPMEA